MNGYNATIVEAVFREQRLPAPIFEYKFHPDRKWRFDVAFEQQKVAIEVQGGIFVQGRHNRGAALLKEWEKLNAAAALGWRVLFCQPSDLFLREMIETIRKTLNQ